MKDEIKLFDFVTPNYQAAWDYGKVGVVINTVPGARGKQIVTVEFDGPWDHDNTTRYYTDDLRNVNDNPAI